MKIKVLIAILLTSTSLVKADVSTNTSTLMKIGGDIATFFTDAQPYFTNGVRAGIAGLYNESQNKGGGLLDVQVKIDNQLSIGFAFAYYNNQFYDAALSMSVGTTWKVPVAGDIYTELETGPGYNLSKNEVIAQSFVLIHRKWAVGNKYLLVATLGVGNVSDVSGAMYTGGINFGF